MPRYQNFTSDYHLDHLWRLRGTTSPVTFGPDGWVAPVFVSPPTVVPLFQPAPPVKNGRVRKGRGPKPAPVCAGLADLQPEPVIELNVAK
jgi:hypothetical protein